MELDYQIFGFSDSHSPLMIIIIKKFSFVSFFPGGYF